MRCQISELKRGMLTKNNDTEPVSMRMLGLIMCFLQSSMLYLKVNQCFTVIFTVHYTQIENNVDKCTVLILLTLGYE